MSLVLDPASVYIGRESSLGRYYAMATGVRWGEHLLCWKTSGNADFGFTGWNTVAFPMPFKHSPGTRIAFVEAATFAVPMKPVLFLFVEVTKDYKTGGMTFRPNRRYLAAWVGTGAGGFTSAISFGGLAGLNPLGNPAQESAEDLAQIAGRVFFGDFGQR